MSESATGPVDNHKPVTTIEPVDAARMLAAMAKSLRATLMRDRRLGDPVTYGDLADAVELVELLARQLADHLAENVSRETPIQP